MTPLQQKQFERALAVCRDNSWELISTTYTRNTDMMYAKCPEGHLREIIFKSLINGPRCRVCAGQCPIESRKKFFTAIEEQGGEVTGNYVDSTTPVPCKCSDGHECNPTPSNVLRGKGMCKTCAGQDPADTERQFRERISYLEGRVTGQYKGCLVPITCICPFGHECSPTPHNVLRGRGMCRVCVGQCPDESERKFRDAVAKQGGVVIGKVTGAGDKTHCQCKVGHDCYPRPSGVIAGGGMCKKCAIITVNECNSEKFKAFIESLGGRMTGLYVNCFTPVPCICPYGHPCRSTPNSVMNIGCNMCQRCTLSGGATLVALALEKMKIPFIQELSFPGDRRRYDFCIIEKASIIEFDGGQHFQEVKIFSGPKLDERQIIDARKTITANNNGYNMFRIDNEWIMKKNVDDVVAAITYFFASKLKLLVSTPSRYEWLRLLMANPLTLVNREKEAPLQDDGADTD